MRPFLPTLLLLAPVLDAQCRKPSIPPQGLSTGTYLDRPLTYSDGYKTLFHLTYPTPPAPSCGWPLVVFVHGYGGRRSVQRGLASRGYVVAAQDVRGQGTAKSLNPGTMGMTFYGPTEKYDLAELVAQVRKKWPKLVSQTKLAVTGASQGGIHSWFAAAYSGRQITISGRGTITFPQVTVAAPQNFIPDVLDHMFRGDTLFANDGITRMLVSKAAVLDPGLVADFKKFFLAQDPLGWVKKLRSEPGRPVAPLLSSTRVPILFAMGWMDNIQSPREALPVLRNIPATTPLQSILSTLGHGSPMNDYENVLRSEQRIRWFDRYLWEEKNGVGTEARWNHGLLPLQGSVRGNRLSLWSHRFDDGYPAKDLAPSRLYLTSAGQLLPKAPVGGTPSLIQHQVRTGYTASAYMGNAGLRSVSGVLLNIPMSQRSFAMTSLAGESELGGTPGLSLSLVPDAERFTISALLTARIPGQVGRTLISSWARGVIGAAKGSPLRLEFALSPIFCSLPKGTVLELHLRNHWIRESPWPRTLVTAPYFVSSRVQVRHGSGVQASFLELPFRKRVRAGLVSALHGMRVIRPVRMDFELRGGAARSGRLHLVLASLSGQAPALPLPGDLLRLVPDPVTNLFLASLGTPFLGGFLGTLDAKGTAKAFTDWASLAPLPKELSGQRMTFAAWIFDSGSSLLGSASNPVDLNFR